MSRDGICKACGKNWGQHFDGPFCDNANSGQSRKVRAQKGEAMWVDSDPGNQIDWTHAVHRSFYQSAGGTAMRSPEVVIQATIGPTAKVVPEWPDTCPGCGGPAYDGLNDVMCRYSCQPKYANRSYQR